MNAVVQQSGEIAALPERVASPVSPAESMLALLARAADPASGFDIDRMREIRALHQEIKADEARVAFAAAFAAMQGDLPVVAQGGYDTHKKIAYSRLEDVLTAARPAMQRHGFGIDFDIVTGKDGITVTGTLTHSLGHSRSTTRWYPIDTGPGRSAIQALGSSETYGRRYVMMSLLNIASDKDDDGAIPEADRNPTSKRKAEKEAVISEKQVDDLRDLLHSLNRSEARFCAHRKIDSLNDIWVRFYDDIVSEVKAAGARK